jgi:hypothetical protein
VRLVAQVVAVLAASVAVAAAAPGERDVEVGLASRAALTVDGPANLAATETFRLRLDQLDEGEPRLRLVESKNGLALIVYVERATLRSIIGLDIQLRPSLGQGTDVVDGPRAGSPLAEGTAVDVIAPGREPLVAIALTRPMRCGALRLSGYVDAGVLSLSHHPYTPPAVEAGAPDVTLPPSFKLRDAPGGEAFAIGSSRFRVPAATLYQHTHEALVALADGTRGWINVGQLMPVTPVDLHRVCPAPAARSRRPGRPTLPLGALVYDAIDGQMIGWIDDIFDQPIAQRQGDWLRFDVPTRFGVVSVWSAAP